MGVTLMSVAMITVVFISVMFLPSLIRGEATAITKQVTGTLTGDLLITAADAPVIADADSYLGQVRATDGVAAATGITRVATQIAHAGESGVWGVDAIDPDSFAEVFSTPGRLIEGEWLSDDDTHGIVLGVDIAGADLDDLRGYAGSLKTVHVGDTVDVTLMGGGVSTFQVRGIYRNNFVLSDSGAFIPEAAMEQLAGSDFTDTAGRIVVAAEPGVTSTELVHRMRPIRSDVELHTPDQLAGAIQDQLDTFDLIDSIMRSISLLVAAITVFIITYVDLVGRRRQIGIERAIGIRSSAIVTGYVLKSLLTATVGTVVGWALFRFLIMPLVERHPFQFPTGPSVLETSPDHTMRTAVILLAVAAISALIPAVRTARMRILDAIWGN
jgi:putative ABC transport system permease protein